MPVPRSGAVRRHSGGTAYAGRNGRLRLRQCPVLSRPGTRAVWGCYTAGVTWRYYGPQRFVGGFGIDFEYLQRGFSFLQNPTEEDPAKYQWYTRRVKSLMLPIVWQPHIYLFKNRMRVYLDAAVFSPTTSPRHSSTNKVRRYLRSSPKVLGGENMISKWSATTGGGTVWRAAAVSPYWWKQLEFSVRVRYYFGYSDLLRNHNKYAGNTTDGYENPFYTTPQRSPLDNLTFSIGVSYRFNKSGFTEWNNRPPKRDKNKEVFNYKGVTK